MKVDLSISLISKETKLVLHFCTDMSTISSLLNNFQTCSSVLAIFDRLGKASKTLHFHSFPYQGKDIPAQDEIIRVATGSVRRAKGCSGCLQGLQWLLFHGSPSAARRTGPVTSGVLSCDNSWLLRTLSGVVLLSKTKKKAKWSFSQNSYCFFLLRGFSHVCWHDEFVLLPSCNSGTHKTQIHWQLGLLDFFFFVKVILSLQLLARTILVYTIHHSSSSFPLLFYLMGNLSTAIQQKRSCLTFLWHNLLMKGKNKQTKKPKPEPDSRIHCYNLGRFQQN